MFLKILGIYSFIMLFLMTVGSVWANVKKEDKQFKYYAPPVVVCAAPILAYILITLVR